MNFALLKSQLAAYHDAEELLSVELFAKLVAVHPRTFDKWLRRSLPGFPKAIRPSGPGTARYWRPDELLEWITQYEAACADLLTAEQVADEVGVHVDSLARMVRRGRFPKPLKQRQLITNRRLWHRDVVRAWKKANTGGYKFPPGAAGKREMRPNDGARRAKPPIRVITAAAAG